MAEMKTTVSKASVEDFLNGLGNAQRREDAFTILKMMKSVTGQSARMWGPSIVGFDKYHYKYASGREGEICMIGFSPRSQALTLYIMPGFKTRDSLLKKLGKHTSGKGCVYIRKLEDVDMKTLKQLVADSYQHMKKTYT